MSLKTEDFDVWWETFEIADNLADFDFTSSETAAKQALETMKREGKVLVYDDEDVNSLVIALNSGQRANEATRKLMEPSNSSSEEINQAIRDFKGKVSDLWDELESGFHVDDVEAVLSEMVDKWNSLLNIYDYPARVKDGYSDEIQRLKMADRG